jgi:Bacterial Ig-like domain
MSTLASPRFLQLQAALLALTGLLATSPEGWAASPGVSSVPADGATGVSPTSAVVFTFSAAMDTNAVMVLFSDASGSPLTTSNSWSAGYDVLSCVPTPAFQPDAQVDWTVIGQDLAGNFVAASGGFTVSGPPILISSDPASGDTDISPSSEVVFTFSAPMDTNHTTATFADARAPSTPLPISASWSADLTTLTCSPSSWFPSPDATINWSLGGKDLAGDSLQGVTSGSFTTGTLPPTLLSVVPTSAATGVSTTAPVVFTFSEPMDTNQTKATFIDIASPTSPLPITVSWSSDLTVLTCTPNPAFPAGSMIAWSLDGQSLAGDALQETTDRFYTISSGGSGNSNTNLLTSFSVGTGSVYEQNSGTNLDFYGDSFSATTSLSSNRSASAVSVTPPGGATHNLTPAQNAPWIFAFSLIGSGQTFLTNYPSGDYRFAVQAASSNQQVIVSLPASLALPNTPRVANISAAQSVDPSQPFTLTWGAFQGAAASSLIIVDVDDPYGKSVFSNALASAATSVVIPAAKLQTNTQYQGYISFENFLGNTNSIQVTFAFRATMTLFNLTTSSGVATAPLVLTNAARAGNIFGFQVLSSPGQSLTVEYSTTLNSGSWTTLLVTNSPGRVQITDAFYPASRDRLYRARKGP